MRLRIISDGTPEKTFVVDEANRPVENVRRVTWEISSGKPAVAVIELVDTPITAAGHDQPTQVHLVCPLCETRAVVPVKEVGNKAEYEGTERRLVCFHCKRSSKGGLWFDTSGMN